MHVIPHQVLPIVLPAGHHLYFCPKSVNDDIFPTKKEENPKPGFPKTLNRTYLPHLQTD